MDDTDVAKCREILKDAGSILLLSHEKPDGDAIASILAMRRILSHISDANVVPVCVDEVPKAFKFLPDAESIKSDFLGGDVQAVVILDCGDLKRTGFADRLTSMFERGVPIINVDHHPKNDLHRMASVNLIDTNMASTTEILYQLAIILKVPIDASLATLLFTGLYTDTGSFQHAITTSQVLQIASTLLSRGARLKEVRQNLANSKPVPMLKLWGIALSRVRIHQNGLVASVITADDMRRSGGTEDDLAGIVSLLESVHNCRVALLVSESDGHIRGSLRSNNSRVNVAKIARVMGGGGHPKAAGFSIEGKLKMDKEGWKVVI